MWPSNSGYFTTRYWVTDYWFDASTTVPTDDRFVGSVLMPGNVGAVLGPGNVGTAFSPGAVGSVTTADLLP